MDGIPEAVFLFSSQIKAILLLLAWNNINISSKLVSLYTDNMGVRVSIASYALIFLFSHLKYFTANSLTLITPTISSLLDL